MELLQQEKEKQETKTKKRTKKRKRKEPKEKEIYNIYINLERLKLIFIIKLTLNNK